jgi:hypothetical protein
MRIFFSLTLRVSLKCAILNRVRDKHPSRYFLLEAAETGVGSRFRVSRSPCGKSLAENDSRTPSACDGQRSKKQLRVAG